MTVHVCRITVEGVVQGVGFRPFVYLLAKKHNISGFVRNTKFGVEIEAKGSKSNLITFIDELKNNPPRLALIKNIAVEEKLQEEATDDKKESSFVIAPSHAGEERSIFLSPDAAICENCKNDFYDRAGRYHNYPFVNCTNCGPRFSIITDYPYDRINTTMSRFIMCDKCRSEYTDINSRRYHAEPVSCNDCGPSYRMLDSSLKEVITENLFETARYLLKIGKIIAVKGVGGYHLVCDGKNGEALKTLRQRKMRDTKPFAVMFKDIVTLKRYCYCSAEEEALFKGKESPILLLKQKSGALEDRSRLLICGSSPYLGAMLPYAPYQYLLLEDFEMLIFTSGNISGEPIVYRDEDLKRLSAIADYFILHNREIVRFVEDSVVKFLNYNHSPLTVIIRKSRGYAPSPLFLRRRYNKQILGLGGDLKSTISFVKDDVLIQSQYLGDLSDYLSFEDYKRTIADFKNFFSLKADTIVCDLHPSYLSSQYAEELAGEKTELVRVQHHKAHIASVAFEHGWFDDNFIGISLDGTGYGEDGAIWGSEVFFGSLKSGFQRAGHLSYLSLPFGDAAVKEPEKIAFSYLTYCGLMDGDLLSIFSEKTRDNSERLKEFVNKSSTFTSSTGRLFDAISFLLGFRRKIGYEGEAAIELENQIYKRFSLQDKTESYDYRIIKDGNKLLIDTKSLLSGVVMDFKAGNDGAVISLKFHSTLISAFLEIVKKIREERGINRIALSGGSFQNSYLLYHFIKRLEKEGFQWAVNRYSPPNDACVSIGQCAIVAEKGRE
ncbi:MAG: carbamoyltransferase HypF [bacterium]